MEKGNNSLGIYYLLILFFIILIIIPPFFRYSMPNEGKTKKDTTKSTTNTTTDNTTTTDTTNTNPTTPAVNPVKNMSCSLDETYVTYNIVSKYNNSVVTNISFAYTIKQNIPANTPMNNMHTVINNLKTVPGAAVQDTGTQLSIQFALENNNVPDALKQYAQEINAQKASYEAMGLKCNIE